MLHQGIQRRIAVTMVYEHAPELLWREMKEVVVGMNSFVAFVNGVDVLW